MIYRKKRERNAIPGVAPCIAARLAPGWRFVSAGKGFKHLETKKSFRIQGLPPSTRVELRYPELAGIAQESMSKDDKELALYLQFVFHRSARLDKHLARIESWAAIESAYVVPMPDLPASDGPAITVDGKG